VPHILVEVFASGFDRRKVAAKVRVPPRHQPMAALIGTTGFGNDGKGVISGVDGRGVALFDEPHPIGVGHNPPVVAIAPRDHCAIAADRRKRTRRRVDFGDVNQLILDQRRVSAVVWISPDNHFARPKLRSKRPISRVHCVHPTVQF
jgi:hypothetical protein